MALRAPRRGRPGLDQLLAEARRGQFDVLMVWACDRGARSVKHFPEMLGEMNRLNGRGPRLS